MGPQERRAISAQMRPNCNPSLPYWCGTLTWIRILTQVVKSGGSNPRYSSMCAGSFSHLSWPSFCVLRVLTWIPAPLINQLDYQKNYCGPTLYFLHYIHKILLHWEIFGHGPSTVRSISLIDITIIKMKLTDQVLYTWFNCPFPACKHMSDARP